MDIREAITSLNEKPNPIKTTDKQRKKIQSAGDHLVKMEKEYAKWYIELKKEGHTASAASIRSVQANIQQSIKWLMASRKDLGADL